MIARAVSLAWATRPRISRLFPTQSVPMNIEQARFNMIEQQIRPWDVLDGGVLGLLSRVRREDFVPAELRSLAFTDTEIPCLKANACWPRAWKPGCCRNCA